MKKLTTLLVLVGAMFFSNHDSFAQLASSCETCFSSEVTKAEKISDQCTRYELKVFYTEKCKHDLSHFTVGVPSCASISNVTNSEGWKVSIGKDPTTTISGFKIDDIQGFGSGSKKSFTVSFTLCSTSASCDALKCWEPVVAYKAGNCFESEKIKAVCPSLKASIEKQDATCFGSSNGSLKIIVEEGTAPYQYAWNTGSTESSLVNVGKGDYSVIMKDATGAEVVLTATITEPPAIELSASTVQALCFGKNTGSIDASITGGVEPISYLWSNGALTQDLTDLKAGVYKITITDGSGCQTSASYTITNQTTLTISNNVQQPGCGNANGSIAVTVSGGTEPYTYLWTNGETTSSLNEIRAGSYKVVATDASGCSMEQSIFVKENNTLRGIYTIQPTSCLDDKSGSIDLTVTGGTEPYTYSWSNGETTEDLSGLAAGNYTAVITDAAGCTFTLRASIFKKSFIVSAEVEQPNCYVDTGAITVTPSNGVEPYAYSWSTGATTETVSDLAPGNYTVTVTDATGCSRVMVYTITTPSELKSSILVTAANCAFSKIDLTVSGGTQPYTYDWSNDATTQDIDSVEPGDYSVTITDAKGCTITQTVTVTEVAVWSCAIQPLSTTPICGSNSNTLTTSVTDGTSYNWAIRSSDGSWKIDSPTNTASISFTAGTSNSTATFTLTITKEGCVQTCTYQVATCTASGGDNGEDNGEGDGGDDDDDGGTNSESCDDCFSSIIVKTSQQESCVTYRVTVSTNGNCRHELSHFTIAIPCGNISNYSTTSNWPLVIGKDPTTGLTGLKVDNVNNFGKEVDSFELTFTVCYTSICGDDWKAWNPVVAYKAGLCVGYDTLTLSATATASVYPNPFTNAIHFTAQGAEDEEATVEFFDQYGQRVFEKTIDHDEWNQDSIQLDVTALKPGIYYYQLRFRDHAERGKLLKI